MQQGYEEDQLRRLHRIDGQVRAATATKKSHAPLAAVERFAKTSWR